MCVPEIDAGPYRRMFSRPADRALVDMHEANARVPYSDSRYDQASQTLDCWLFILCGDHWVARDVRDMMLDCFHEPNVAERMIVLYMSEVAADLRSHIDV